jgi:HEPN domain-containing protein
MFLYMAGGNREEAGRWFRQAEHDLEAADISMKGGSSAWACFQSQQAAEKAVKALLYEAGYRKILSHSVYELLLEARKITDGVPLLEQEAKMLDNVYITSRYPNGLAGRMTPSEYYTREDAERCLRSAGSILDAVRRCILT